MAGADVVGGHGEVDASEQVAHLREVALHVIGIGRSGMQAGVQHAFADHGIDRADQSGFDACRREDGVNEIAGRRFAVRARDADDAQPVESIQPIACSFELGLGLSRVR